MRNYFPTVAATAAAFYIASMVRLKSRTNCPVNGFWFRQPETGFNQQTWDFNSLVQQVQAMRKANPRFNLSTDVNAIAEEVDQQNALRMLSIPRADSYIVSDAGPAPNFPFPAQAPLRPAAGALNRLNQSKAVLVEWLGTGGVPVGRDLAEKRAVTCQACAKNVRGDWTRWFTVPAAQAIRKTLEARTDLNLALPNDDALGVCEVCLCSNKLKPWVPLAVVKDKTTPEIMAELPPNCWVVGELSSEQ